MQQVRNSRFAVSAILTDPVQFAARVSQAEIFFPEVASQTIVLRRQGRELIFQGGDLVSGEEWEKKAISYYIHKIAP